MRAVAPSKSAAPSVSRSASAIERTDIHRPSVIDPADYEFVGEEDLHDEEGFAWYDTEKIAAIQGRESANIERSAKTGHTGYATCQHCGHKGLRYLAVFIHKPTGELLTVGFDCAETLSLDSRTAIQRRKASERHRREAVRKTFLAKDDHAELIEWLEAQRVEAGGTLTTRDDFLDSLLGQFQRKGELSAKQVEALRKSRERRAEWAKQREEEQADEPEPTPIPDEVTEGRATITGRILASKYKGTDFGETLKMLVLDDRGFKVWGTQPESLVVATDPETNDGWIVTSDYPESTPAEWIETRPSIAHGEYRVARCRVAKRGDRVRFDASVTRSDDDETFGFFKRPTKATVID